MTNNCSNGYSSQFEQTNNNVINNSSSLPASYNLFQEAVTTKEASCQIKSHQMVRMMNHNVNHYMSEDNNNSGSMISTRDNNNNENIQNNSEDIFGGFSFLSDEMKMEIM